MHGSKYAGNGRGPEQPLVYWGYEASPFCKVPARPPLPLCEGPLLLQGLRVPSQVLCMAAISHSCDICMSHMSLQPECISTKLQTRLWSGGYSGMVYGGAMRMMQFRPLPGCAAPNFPLQGGLALYKWDPAA